tara:strand:- start:49 stop:276 length:228 start_codon:yes stop_codon:yes gene_type:complete
MKEDESWEDPKIYFERLEKLALSLGYTDDGYGYPIEDMLRNIQRLRQDVSFLLELVDGEGLYKFRRFQEGRDWDD